MCIRDRLYYSGIKELSHLTITLNEIDILGKLDILGWTKWCINAGHNNKSPDLGKTLCSGSTCLSPFIEFMLACGLGSKKLIDAGFKSDRKISASDWSGTLI